MLNKQQLNKKLQERRVQKILTEKNEFEKLKQNHINEINSLENDIKSLNSKQINLKQEEKDNKIKLQNFKESEYSLKISQLNDENNNLHKKINPKKIPPKKLIFVAPSNRQCRPPAGPIRQRWQRVLRQQLVPIQAAT